MSLMRCPKCQSIVDSEDESCHYCGYKLNTKVEIPKEGSFAIDSDKIDSVSGDRAFRARPEVITTKDPSILGPYEKPSIYSPQRVKSIKLKYFIYLIVSALFIGVGVFTILISLEDSSSDKIEGFLTVGVGTCIMAGLAFIYALVRIIQAFRHPVLACYTDESLEDSASNDVADAALAVAVEIVNNIID